MIVEGQKVKVKWHGNNRKHFEEKGYVFTNYRDEFTVNISDLTDSQTVDVLVSCDYCKTEKNCKYNKVSKKEHHYCDTSCMYKFKQQNNMIPPKEHDYCCDYCRRNFKVANYRYERLKSGEYKNLFCSKNCLSLWNAENTTHDRKNISKTKHKIICACCNEEFYVPESRKNRAKYCSEDCKRKASITSQIIKCDNCNKEVKKVRSVLENNKNVFCSQECASEHRSKIHNEDRKCEICDEIFTTKKSSSQRFCSIKCQGLWQSQELIGENANGYNRNIPFEMRFTNCRWCGLEFQLSSPYKVKNKENNNVEFFCSVECRKEWYAKEWSQSEEWKLESKERAVRMLENSIGNTETGCQLEVNNILNELGIKYANEYNCKYVAIDNYLVDYNLMIEVMGTYWHTDHRMYKEINYQMQVDRIKNDKIKKSFIKSQYKIDILYLWEEDILNNRDLIVELIKHYINNNGVLLNYHSFNYELNDDGLKLTKSEIPYMEYDIKELRPLIDIKTKKRSMKQLDKWTTFNCENCGETKEQLTSHYNKSKTHCCSKKCAYELKKKNNSK